MSRCFTDTTLLIASHNEGKVKELMQLFAPYHIRLISAAERNIPEPEETGSSFLENALLKARYYSEASGLPALADDSGLAIEALNGEPGIYSARLAGAEKNFSLAMDKVEQQLVGYINDKAVFICALALCWADGECEAVEGKMEGRISFPQRGSRGFGYDPIFIPNGYDLTCGEMEPEKKNAISHRADAFKQLIERCFRHG